MDRIVVYNPLFSDITRDVGGTTADLTLEIANKRRNIVRVDTIMHLTCTNMLVEKINHALHTIKSNGLQIVLAFRGDRHMAGTNLCGLKVALLAHDLVPIPFTFNFPHLYNSFYFANLSWDGYITISSSLGLYFINSRLHLEGL
ncbi:hypothetical protein ACSQ67_025671 [Phaseolus vulgaris]